MTRGTPAADARRSRNSSRRRGWDLRCDAALGQAAAAGAGAGGRGFGGGSRRPRVVAGARHGPDDACRRPKPGANRPCRATSSRMEAILPRRAPAKPLKAHRGLISLRIPSAGFRRSSIPLAAKAVEELASGPAGGPLRPLGMRQSHGCDLEQCDAISSRARPGASSTWPRRWAQRLPERARSRKTTIAARRRRLRAERQRRERASMRPATRTTARARRRRPRTALVAAAVGAARPMGQAARLPRSSCVGRGAWTIGRSRTTI